MVGGLLRAAPWAALGLLVVSLGAAVTLAAGPPFPPPVDGQRVYDTASVFRPSTVAAAEATIRAIEQRTGAQVAVYTQVLPYRATSDETEAHARTLMDQWGVGRKGFDDGLVIFYDLDPSRCHGQVQLYAGAGFRATFLSDAERQRIFDEQMLPYLERCQLDESLLVALQRVDAAATPEHAASLERARQLDALLGLVIAPVTFLLLVGWAAWSWLRHGRDPEYLDDPSIHVPAPPPDLTPASGALVLDGRSSRHTLTTALIDLASRGELTFREEAGGLLSKPKVAITIGSQPASDPRAAWARERARRQPTGPAEAFALERLRERAGADGELAPDELLSFSEDVGGFDERLESHVVARGWFTEKPTAATRRWYLRGGLELAAGIGAIVAGSSVPVSGLVLVGVALVAAAAVTLVLARSMPARTLAGAMIRAMLAAYRRTLEKTMVQARSIDQVVREAGLAWLETPDLAVVWGVALGLHGQVEKVLARSVDDVRAGRSEPGSVYLPAWYTSGAGSGSGSGGSGGPSFGGGSAFSSSAIPNFGAMMAVVGTIGSPPASSSGGGGGFGGGGGGGGGGAGGGF